MEETIDLREYFGIIKKRFWIIALITVVAAVISGVISFFVLQPVYETKTVKMYSYKTRTYIEGTKDYKWSYKNDRTLLDNGWYYTGATKLDK